MQTNQKEEKYNLVPRVPLFTSVRHLVNSEEKPLRMRKKIEEKQGTKHGVAKSTNEISFFIY